MRNIDFEAGAFYHVYNRGVDKRPIFLNDQDRIRFISSLISFNDKNVRSNISLSKQITFPDKQDALIAINAYCLMDNHFHLLIQLNEIDGISKFLARLQNGYTKYFNKKYERSGRLFSGPYRIRPILTEQHYLHISRYIHLNPLKIKKSEHQISSDTERFSIHELSRYRWSSLNHYLQIEKQSFVESAEIMKSFSGVQDYVAFLQESF